MSVREQPPRQDLRQLRAVVAARRVELPPPVQRRAIRQLAGLSVVELAEFLQVGESTVTCWELGLRSPRGWRRDRYAAALRALREGQA